MNMPFRTEKGDTTLYGTENGRTPSLIHKMGKPRDVLEHGITIIGLIIPQGETTGSVATSGPSNINTNTVQESKKRIYDSVLDSAWEHHETLAYKKPEAR